MQSLNQNLMNKLVYLGTIFALFYEILSSDDNFPFQKNLWSFWDKEDISNANIIVQACYQKLKKSAQVSGFKYTLLNSNTAKNYITGYEQKIKKVRQKSSQKQVQHLADLIRFHIISEHGGIWVDITTILPNGFQWLLNIRQSQYHHLITNRFSPQPDVLLFYFPSYQNTAEYLLATTQPIYYNQLPGYEIWFLAAKKHSPLIKQIAETYSQFTQLSYKELMTKFHEENIFMNGQDGSSYLTGNMAISYVLQRKQFEIDRRVGLWGERETVYREYRLWSLNALLGPLVWTAYEHFNVMDLFEHPVDYFESQGISMHFFLKIVGDVSKIFIQRIQSLQWWFTTQNMTVAEFIASKPDLSQCQWWIFIVQGSIIADLFAQTPYLTALKIPTIPQTHNIQWKQYCSRFDLKQQNSLLNQIYDFIFFSEYPPNRFFDQTRRITDTQQTKQSITVYYLMKRLFEEKDIYLYSLWRYLIDCGLMLLGCLVVCAVWVKVRGLGVEIGNSSREGRIAATSSTNLNFILVAFLFLFTLALTTYWYVSIDDFGTRDHPFSTLFILLLTFTSNHYIHFHLSNPTLKTSQANHSLKIIYSNIRLMLIHQQTYMILTLMIKGKVWLHFCSLVIGPIGEILLNFLEKLAERNSESVKSNLLLRDSLRLRQSSMFAKLSLATMTGMWLIPNLRHYTLLQSYLISHFPSLALIYLLSLYIMIVKTYYRTLPILQTIRVVTLPFIVLLIYVLIPYRNMHIWYRFTRTKWNILATIVLSIIYVQMGSSLARQQKPHLRTLFKYFGMIVVVLTVSSFMWVGRLDNSNLLTLEFFVIIVNNLLLTLHINQGLNEEIIQTQELVSMDKVQVEVTID